MQLNYSFIIPVFNRPNEIDELLLSLTQQTFKPNFEVVIIEDGSTVSSKNIVKKYDNLLTINYYEKKNTGPGDSRNFGMRKAKGNYYIILDSDCILPKQYLVAVEKSLQDKYVDCFGGPDTAHKSFTNLQKAINYVMTSFLTTGGIRGNKKSINKFQPRSFNMGISEHAFFKTKGFGNIHPGEDPDLTIRFWKAGFKTKLIPEAFVYHKRRVSWKKFHQQVQKFGKCRPILNSWHPETAKITYWFPAFFVFTSMFSIVMLFFKCNIFAYLLFGYLVVLFIDSSFKNRSLIIGFQSVIAACIQFFGYGIGFLISFFRIFILKKKPQEAFPYLFFN